MALTSDRPLSARLRQGSPAADGSETLPFQTQPKAVSPTGTSTPAPGGSPIDLPPDSLTDSPIHTAAAANRASATAIVRLHQVSKVYRNGACALADVTLQIRKGDFLFITGHSGSGKSTLLKLFYGEERPTQGEIIVNDLNLQKLRGDRLATLRRQIGVVFQDYKLISRRTVAENVAFVLWAQGFTRKEIQRRLAPALKMVGLQDKADCFPEQLSGGEQQRVSIARAIVGTPPLLLADEPTGNLDTENAQQILSILKKLHSIGVTVVVTTHDQQLVQATDFPVLQLRNGRLSQVKR